MLLFGKGDMVITQAQISRRSFLLGTCGLCALMLPGCAGVKQPVSDQTASAYYGTRLPELLKIMDDLGAYMRPILISDYGEGLAKAVNIEARERFQVMARSLPYIGGKENELTEDLEQAAMALSFYQAMKTQSKTSDESGRIIYETVATNLAAYPGILFRSGWIYRTSSFGRRKNRRAADASKQRIYPGDWVFDYVKGDGKAFDWGIDYRECGNIKLCKAQNAEEFAPYLCIIDQLVFEKAGAGLVRTQTLAGGAEFCDFRFKSGRHTRLLDPFSKEHLEAWKIVPGL